MISTSYPLRSSSSTGIFIRSLVQALKPFAAVRVVCPADNEITSEPTALAVAYAPRAHRRYYNVSGGALGSKSYLRSALAPVLFFSLLWKAWYVSKHSQAIIGHWSFSGVVAGICGRLRCVPSAVFYRGTDINSIQHSRLLRLLFFVSAKLCTHRIFVSESLRDSIKNMYPCIYKNSQVICNGTSQEFFLQRSLLNDHPTTFRLLAVSSLIPIKNVDTIIEACAELRRMTDDFHLVVIGDGPLKKHLVEYRDRHGLSQHIEFLGALPAKDVIRHYHQAHIFIHASSSEGRSGVIAEAMMSGLPVVCSDIPGNNEFIKHTFSGLTFKVGSAETLAEHLYTLMTDLPQYNHILRNIEKFRDTELTSWTETAKALGNIFCQMSNQSQ